MTGRDAYSNYGGCRPVQLRPRCGRRIGENAAAEPVERGAQPIVVNAGDGLSTAAPRPRRRAGAAPGGPAAWRRDRPLHDPETADRAIAQESVDPLDDLPGLVLDIDRARPLDAAAPEAPARPRAPRRAARRSSPAACSRRTAAPTISGHAATRSAAAKPRFAVTGATTLPTSSERPIGPRRRGVSMVFVIAAFLARLAAVAKGLASVMLRCRVAPVAEDRK